MVGKVRKLAFRRILRFVISSFLEGVMTILLPKGQPRISTRDYGNKAMRAAYLGMKVLDEFVMFWKINKGLKVTLIQF